jgi:hypothetical protein
MHTECSPSPDDPLRDIANGSRGYRRQRQGIRIRLGKIVHFIFGLHLMQALDRAKLNSSAMDTASTNTVTAGVRNADAPLMQRNL